jgi:hypothetical protein
MLLDQEHEKYLKACATAMIQTLRDKVIFLSNCLGPQGELVKALIGILNGHVANMTGKLPRLQL